jgi:hypothetical protein
MSYLRIFSDRKLLQGIEVFKPLSWIIKHVCETLFDDDDDV